VIVRITTAGTYVDAAALFVHFERRYAFPTIRKWCTPVGKDPASGNQLYDLESAEEAMAQVKPRNPHRKQSRRTA